MKTDLKNNFAFVFLLLCSLTVPESARALQHSQIQPALVQPNLVTAEAVVVQSLSKLYPGAEIEISKEVKLSLNSDEIASLRFENEDGKGSAYFSTGPKQIRIPFSAWVNVPIATRRISPLEKLSADMFSAGRVDLSSGLTRPYRGILLSLETHWNDFETKQTILPGSYPLTTQVQRVPDVRRGDSVEVLIKASTLTLTTPAIAQEPGSVGDKIRILTRQNKRELVGVLVSRNKIEVQQ